MAKLIIEVRANEYTMRALNPHVPWTSEELGRDAAACAEAGAAIYHFHARRPDGAPDHSLEGYEAAIRSIRADSDLLVHPTLGAVTLDAPPERRLAHIEALCRDDALRPDFAPMDVGSTNEDRFDPITRRFLTTDRVYKNPTATLLHFAKRFRQLAVKPYVMSWNIPFTRQIEALIECGSLHEPLFLAFNLTDGLSLAGHPGTARGLQAHLDFLPPRRKLEWTACNHGGNLLPLVGMIVANGGHVSIGVGDYPYGELGFPSNHELVAAVCAIARQAGREIATPEEARSILGMTRSIKAHDA